MNRKPRKPDTHAAGGAGPSFLIFATALEAMIDLGRGWVCNI
jgi:hypothetical protein